jgi:adenine-specific DNA-methyltransferase
LNYIGSKWSLLPFITRTLATHEVREGVFLDLFAGTTAVGQLAKRLGFQVVSNDWQYYSYVLGSAYIKTTAYPDFAGLKYYYPQIFNIPVPKQSRLPFSATDTHDDGSTALQQVLAWLNALPGEAGLIYRHYCLGGTRGGEFERQYFSDANGQRCDAIRNILKVWRKQAFITESEYFVLLASLLEAIDKVANTASVYAAFLKRLKASACKPLRLELPPLILNANSHQVFQKDANSLIGEIEAELVYIDPPYNQRQYNANYHLLETIACDDDQTFILPNVTGLRADAELSSAYCQKDSAIEAFADLLEKARTRHILVSYNDEGVIPFADMQAMLRGRGCLIEHTRRYKRFRADQNRPGRQYAPNDYVQELLLYVQVESKSVFLTSSINLNLAQIESLFQLQLENYNRWLVAKYLITHFDLTWSEPIEEATLLKSKQQLDQILNQVSNEHDLYLRLSGYKQNIERGAVRVSEKLLALLQPAQLTALRTSIEGLVINFELAGQMYTIPVVLKTLKISKLELGQTSNLYQWFETFFDMEASQVNTALDMVAPGLALKELQKDYFAVAQLVQRVLTNRLGLVSSEDRQGLDAVEAEAEAEVEVQLTELKGARFLIEQVRRQRGSSAITFINDRNSGDGKPAAAIDEILLELLQLEDITLKAIKPGENTTFTNEIQLRVKHKPIFTIQIKHQRTKNGNQQYKNHFHHIKLKLQTA